MGDCYYRMLPTLRDVGKAKVVRVAGLGGAAVQSCYCHPIAAVRDTSAPEPATLLAVAWRGAAWRCVGARRSGYLYFGCPALHCHPLTFLSVGDIFSVLFHPFYFFLFFSACVAGRPLQRRCMQPSCLAAIDRVRP